MTSDITKSAAALPADEAAEGLFDNWFDPIQGNRLKTIELSL